MKKLNNAYVLSRSKHLCDEDFFSLAREIFETPEFQSMGKFVQHNDVDRITHIMSVAYVSLMLARKWGLDEETTVRSAMLHDLYYYDWHENDWSHRPHGYRHPGFALKNARALCGTLDKKTENTILRHMWPLTVIPPKYKEGYAVCLADKYCAAYELYYSKTEQRRRKLHGLIDRVNKSINQGN